MKIAMSIWHIKYILGQKVTTLFFCNKTFNKGRYMKVIY